MISRPTFRELESSRSNNFDALRFLLAYLVIFSHSYPIVRGSNLTEPLYLLTGGQRTFGETAVDGFFLISGYLITASWQRSRGLIDYLRRRILRIYPGFLVAVVFSSLVVTPLVADDPADFWRKFNFVPFLVQAFTLIGAYTPETTTVNGSLWSIRYEFFCYLGLAAFGLMGILKRRWLVLAFAIFCTGLQAAMIYRNMEMPGSRLTWLWGFPGFWPRLANLFFLGSAFHLFADRIVRSRWLIVASAAGLLAAALIPGSKALPLVMGYLGGYLLFSFAFYPIERLTRITRWGDFSYGLYLYAYPIQVLLVVYFRSFFLPERLTLVAMVLTTGLAACSWHLVEKPFLRFKTKSTTRKDREAPAAELHPAIPPAIAE